MITASEIAANIAHLPSWPIITSRLMEVIGREEHSATEVVRLVSMDATIATKVIRVANSAAYARRGGAAGLSQAVVILGEQIVAGIAIGASAEVLFNSELTGYEMESGALWKHSLRTAFAASELVKRAKAKVSEDQAFTCGLLHDIGKIVISNFLEKNRNQLRAEMSKFITEDFRISEKKYLGVDHCDVGAVLADTWNLPVAIKHCITHHHSPSEAEEHFRHLVYAVHLADVCAMSLGEGQGIDSLSYPLDPRYSDFVEVDRTTVEKILMTVEAKFTDAMSFLNPAGGS